MRRTLRIAAGQRLGRLTWAQRFLLASLVSLVTGMVGVGWWVGEQIENGVIHQTAAYTALYVSSVVEPNLQELVDGQSIAPEHQAILARLLQDTSLGQHITQVNVWDTQGRVVYSTNPRRVGQVFAIDSDLARALRGWVASDISTLDKPENVDDPDRGQRRLETYSPVRRTGTSDIIAAVEFYQTVSDLERNVAAAKQRSWLIVAAATGLIYLVLAGFVRQASTTIQRQQAELSNQVRQLQAVLGHNRQLSERVRLAARRITTLNERVLRRISAELHDGPAQDLALALLRLDHLAPTQAQPSVAPAAEPAPAAGNGNSDFQVVQTSLRHALQEIRAIAAGMGMPELEQVPLAEAVARAVRAHERRTGTTVAVRVGGLTGQEPLPVKITVYRIVQEALSNAYRHAAGADQRVTLTGEQGLLRVVVSDRGPGFDARRAVKSDEHLGLAGMRERVESLGGVFGVESTLGQGTRISAELPLDAPQGEHERQDPTDRRG